MRKIKWVFKKENVIVFTFDKYTCIGFSLQSSVNVTAQQSNLILYNFTNLMFQQVMI